MTERQIAICVMVDDFKTRKGATAKDMLDFLFDVWGRIGGEGDEAGLLLNTVSRRFENPDEKLELTHKP